MHYIIKIGNYYWDGSDVTPFSDRAKRYELPNSAERAIESIEYHAIVVTCHWGL
jgi:hypothetical protein